MTKNYCIHVFMRDHHGKPTGEALLKYAKRYTQEEAEEKARITNDALTRPGIGRQFRFSKIINVAVKVED